MNVFKMLAIKWVVLIAIGNLVKKAAEEGMK